MNQIIYILINEAMPDYIKIGRTADLSRRVKDLDWTNIPLPFQIYFAAKVENADFVEKQLHSIFADNRVRSNREFFKINPERIVAAIKLQKIEDITPKKIVYGPGVREELEKIYKKRFQFEAAKVPIGAKLTFTRDDKVNATVVSNGNIKFNGKIQSLSKAAQTALGVHYPVQGPIFWMYDGETLDERRHRLESSS